MARLRGFFARLRKDESGATMVEYSILIAIITAAAITLILAVGGFVTTAWTDLCADLAALGCSTGGGATPPAP